MEYEPAVFALEDGSCFYGVAFGAKKTVVGEAVFNTSMTGYQEILTDPSYFSQIVTMTAPQIGNYGVNIDDIESAHPQASGFVVREISPVASNWRSTQSLPDYLNENGIPGISGVDTRAITKKLRTSGAMKSCLSTEGISGEEAVKRAREWAGLVGVDFVKDVTRKEETLFEGTAESCTPFTVIGTHLGKIREPRKRFRIAAIDYGSKDSMLKHLYDHGFDVTVFPATCSAEEIEAFNPDGVFLTNGPGDPAAVTYAHETVRSLIDQYPVFGICFGHQVITHAIGGKTFKLKFGHRGGNQPVKNLETGQVVITAQNHGFASEPDSIADRAIVSEINLNDKTVAGLRLKDRPVFSVQYHPEAGPGPNDGTGNFEKFYQMVAAFAQEGES
ncbi:glutamine-hydrolyzing carbamoyl-phosphate synthase small subunit [Puniceicoccus vermicola]|uniref:Carbamoyl phosphate synthase small chain n=1 Tax=Puniceicoccus vermicola TaxID=388746 RepID=A0A7X1AUX1_9BACT|nr:glutamine-hydrolyzing carbamoyl-phosphate synthase small subunit [Puniceicoccus vermicola]MBC2600461.1 glutamine-hydrolyzing carbamoyl-phosphate synthase small subunit [Puniceicoccus vermicola]